MFQAALRETRTTVFSGAGDRVNVPNVGVLVSDGHSTVNPFRTIPEAQLAKADNITMLTVIVNDDYNIDDMRSIASDPVSDVFFLISSDRLDLVVGQVLDRLCNG